MRARVGGGGETGVSGFVPTRRGCAERGAVAVMCAEIGQSWRGCCRTPADDAGGIGGAAVPVACLTWLNA